MGYHVFINQNGCGEVGGKVQALQSNLIMITAFNPRVGSSLSLIECNYLFVKKFYVLNYQKNVEILANLAPMLKVRAKANVVGSKVRYFVDLPSSQTLLLSQCY